MTKSIQPSVKSHFTSGIWLVALAAVVLRIALLMVSHAPVGEADSTIRVFYAIRWMQDPYIFCPTTWPPLQFYIYGAALAIYFDPIYTPIMVNILFAGMLIVAFGCLVQRLMGSDEAGLFAGMFMAVYPLSVRYSLIAQPEIILNALIAMSLLFILRSTARGNGRHVLGADGVLAAIFMGLACWTHMEAWFLAPLFCLLYWRRWTRFIFYGTISAIPIVIFILHTQGAYGGVPPDWYAYSHGASNTVRQLFYYPALLMKTLTPAVILLAVIGFIHVLQNNRPFHRIELFPMLCFFLLLIPYLFFVFAWDRTKPKEALLLSLFILPYAALGLVKVKQLFSVKWAQQLVAASAICMLLAAPYTWKYLHHGGIFPVPRTAPENVKTARWLNKHLKSGDGVVFDHLKQYADFYLAASIRALPDQVFLTLEWPPEKVKKRLGLYLKKQDPEFLVLAKQPGTVSRLLNVNCIQGQCPDDFQEPVFDALFEKNFETDNYVIYSRSNN